MNKALTLITAAILVSGCASTDYARTTEAQHQAAKTQYYQELNQRLEMGTVARNEEQVER